VAGGSFSPAPWKGLGRTFISFGASPRGVFPLRKKGRGGPSFLGPGGGSLTKGPPLGALNPRCGVWGAAGVGGCFPPRETGGAPSKGGGRRIYKPGLIHKGGGGPENTTGKGGGETTHGGRPPPGGGGGLPGKKKRTLRGTSFGGERGGGEKNHPPGGVGGRKTHIPRLWRGGTHTHLLLGRLKMHAPTHTISARRSRRGERFF